MKSIKTKSDLSIHGAAPAFAEPLHVGLPNLGAWETYSSLSYESYQRRWLTNDGPRVRELEERIARRLEVKHCVLMCNGTIALSVAIRALDLKGEVIVPAWTFIATAHALLWQGLTPVFADIDPETHNLDPVSVRNKVTSGTSGIIGVHLWGRPAPIEALEAIAREFQLKLLFDSAHAFGCSYVGQPLGHFGACEVLSFHATKVFNTIEGGAIVTNDDELAQSARLFRNFGFRGYDNVVSGGTNGKMSEFHAAMGIANLEALPDFIEVNRRNHQTYESLLSHVDGVNLLKYDPSTNPNYQYVVLEFQPSFPTPRDDVLAALHAENILARKYFWPGCHRMKPYRDLFASADWDLDATDAVADRVLVLPTGPSIGKREMETIVAIIALLGQKP